MPKYYEMHIQCSDLNKVLLYGENIEGWLECYNVAGLVIGEEPTRVETTDKLIGRVETTLSYNEAVIIMTEDPEMVSESTLKALTSLDRVSRVT